MPYADQLLKWYPYYDPSRPCALICRGIGSSYNTRNEAGLQPEATPMAKVRLEEYDSAAGDEAIVVQLSDKVVDGTKCYPDTTQDICVNGECMVSNYHPAQRFE